MPVKDVGPPEFDPDDVLVTIIFGGPPELLLELLLVLSFLALDLPQIFLSQFNDPHSTS